MQETGIVRRIDELGRVVIPKEIRKTLRIKESDPIEILAEKNQIILRKYTPIVSLNEEIENVCLSLAEETKSFCVVANTDKVVCVSNDKLKDYLDKFISEELTGAIREKKSLLKNKTDGGDVISIVRGENLEAENQIILPIVNDGDVFGCVVLFNKDKELKFSSQEVKLCSLCANIFAKNF